MACWPAGDDLPQLLEAVFQVKVIEDPEEVRPETAEAWTVLVVDARLEPGRRLRASTRVAEDTGVPVLVVVEAEQVRLLAAVDSFADFLVAPVDPDELSLRISRIVQTQATSEVLTYRDLDLDTATYQARVAGRPMDLTFMEYELLRFFLANPVRVWSREQLLARVWGYDYFGGARTVDVHVRRLRAKLGESRAGWVTTVRSVGYRFG
ncbi:MAG TPA: response regulator transcription factor [Acidimicrobiia bacterium]